MHLDSHRVAILVPTKGRSGFIRRMLGYYESIGSPHPIYIGDASGDDVAAELLAYIDTLRIIVKYFHWQGVGPNQTIYMLAQKALEDKFKFCAFHGDDDCFVPDSLTLTADFLISNPDYHTCQGRGALFTLDRPGPNGVLATIDDYWGVNYLDGESGLARLKYFVDHYYVLQFSTHRTADFVKLSEDYAELSNDGVGELLHCYSFALQGRSKFLDCLYLFRQSHPAVHHPLLWDWLLQPEWGPDIQKMINFLAQRLADVDGLPYSRAKVEITEVVRKILERTARYESKRNTQGILNTLILSFRSILPRCAKLIMRKLVSSPRDLSIMYSEKSVYYQQFVPVWNSVSVDSDQRNSVTQLPL